MATPIMIIVILALSGIIMHMWQRNDELKAQISYQYLMTIITNPAQSLKFMHAYKNMNVKKRHLFLQYLNNSSIKIATAQQLYKKYMETNMLDIAPGTSVIGFVKNDTPNGFELHGLTFTGAINMHGMFICEDQGSKQIVLCYEIHHEENDDLMDPI